LLDLFFERRYAAAAILADPAGSAGALYDRLTMGTHILRHRGDSLAGLGGAKKMRIQATAKSGVAAAGAARRTTGSGFVVGNDNAPSQTSAAASAAALNSIDALLALQGVEDAVERRRRFARRGAKALDMLDALKLEILEGRMDVGTLSKLEAMLGELTERSGESRLDETLDAIGVRVAVELAKRRAQ